VAGALGTDPDVEKLARETRRAGWLVEVDSGSTHIRWESPTGDLFFSPLTGARSTVLRVRSKLRRLDPAAFGKMPVLEQETMVISFDDLVGQATDELNGAIQLLSACAQDGDPQEAAEGVRLVRQYLDDLERQLRQRARGR
jgi:hypothetical protein